VYGPDPREGFVRGSAFLHPAMEFRLDVPPAWRTVNQRTVVAAVSGTQDAIVQLTLAEQPTARAALDAFFRQEGVARGPAWVDEINDLPTQSAAFRAATQGGTLRGYVAMIEHGGAVFQVQAMTLEQAWEGYKPTLEQSVGSFARLTDQDALSVEPQRIKVVRPEKAMDLPAFARAYDATVDIKTLAIMNHVAEDAMVEPGRAYKVVVGGTD
jgi:predicted Zn-dependent protease